MGGEGKKKEEGRGQGGGEEMRARKERGSKERGGREGRVETYIACVDHSILEHWIE